jgi:hypothetical protein
MTNNKPPKRLLTIKEAVAVYGVSTWYGRERIWAGELPVLKVGRKQILDSRDIDAFINENKRYEAPR